MCKIKLKLFIEEFLRRVQKRLENDIFIVEVLKS